MPFLPEFDEKTTQRDLFRLWPHLARSVNGLAQQLLREGPFTPAQAELVFSFTSGVNACRYCYNIHRLTAERLGIEENLLETLLDDIDAAPVEERMKPILRYARKLTETPTRIVQADVDAILAAGWDAEAFHYATSICALANYFNRILDGHGIQADMSYWTESSQRLAEKGYSDLKALGVED